ncbi:MAG: hypothetical protein PWR20_1652 [Bacteroidales bacterium]|jgi:PAS domain S-box-containing protein|nr:hypothetical protein [Bacteroidales bacterium]MDN5330592.1 hypothetical protein [Bacteroidales bacterium]
MTINKINMSDIPASFNHGVLVWNAEGQPIDVKIIQADERLSSLTGLSGSDLNGKLLSSLFSLLGSGQELMERLIRHENLQVRFFCEYLGRMVLFTNIFCNNEDLFFVISSMDEFSEGGVGEKLLVEGNSLPLKVFFENAYNWEYWLAPDGSVKMISPSCERITGYAPEEFLLDKDLLKRIVHPDDLNLLGTSLDSDEHDFIMRLKHKNGQIRWIKHVCKAVHDESGNFLGRRVSNTDITELKEAYAELEEARRRLQTLIFNLPGLVYRCKNDPNWTMEFISQGALELTGYPPEAFINNNRLSFNEIIHPDHQERLWNKWQNLLAKREPFYDEYPIITASGETKWVLERGCGVFDEAGNLLALEGFIWDNTEYHNLIGKIQSKSQELAAANEMKDKLLSVIAHDLKNPLGNLIGYCELLLDDYQEMDDAARLEMINYMYQAASMADHLLTNLLDWSRLKNGRYAPRPEMIDLAALVAEIILIHRNIAHQKHIQIHSLIPPATFVRTDQYSVSTILRNLVSNAIKFTFPGKSVRISVHEESYGYLSVNVEDEGVSLTPQEIESILSPNVISSKQGTAGEKGTGMGLKLSIEFAQIIGAHLKARPRNDGLGMLFSVIFPRQ